MARPLHGSRSALPRPRSPVLPASFPQLGAVEPPSLDEDFHAETHGLMDITPVQSDDDWEAARAIRERVFIDEQDCPPEEEWDGCDETSRHVLGRISGEPVATARWRAVPHNEEIVAKLERFAVLPLHREKGYGTKLVEYVVEEARRAGFDTFLVHAQTHLEDWYEDLGFQSTGRTFEEVGIPHVEMVRQEET